MNRRAVGFWGGIAVLLIVVALVSGSRTQSGDPLDPDSTDPLGTRALVLFLEEYDAEIVRGLPDASTSHALVLADQLTEEQRADLELWVDEGGTVIVTDPASELSPQGDPIVDTSGSLRSESCTLDGLDGLDGLTLEAGSFVLYPNSGLNAADGTCFGRGVTSYLHLTERGSGRVVALGGALALTNQNLDSADNAVLTARLLLNDRDSEAEADTKIAVLYEPIFTAGSRSITDLIPQATKWAGWQLLVAFGLYVCWKAPRFGRPVIEPQPVELPGSLLVRAAAELHRRSGGYVEASRLLRRDLEHRLRKQLRVPPERSTAELAQTAAKDNDLQGAVIERAVDGPPGTSGRDLADLLADIDQVNTHVLAESNIGQPPDGDAT